MRPSEIKKIQDHIVCLHSKEEVEAVIDKVAAEMNEKFADEAPLFLCVMNGAVIFMGQLISRLTFPLQIDYIHTSRYRGTMTGSDLRWISEPTISLKDRTIVVIEDILDSGVTLAAILEYCRQHGAKAVYTAALVDKDHPRAEGGVEKADFTGLYVENKFLVGYGLDYQEFFRNLPGIYAVQKTENGR